MLATPATTQLHDDFAYESANRDLSRNVEAVFVQGQGVVVESTWLAVFSKNIRRLRELQSECSTDGLGCLEGLLAAFLLYDLTGVAFADGELVQNLLKNVYCVVTAAFHRRTWHC